jgi:hypothetical protein
MTAPATHVEHQLSQLDQVEAEPIRIFREVAPGFENPVLVFSREDSIVTMRLAQRTFCPKELGLNEIDHVQLRTTVPLLCDLYPKNRTTGSILLVDGATGIKVGAEMINSGS